jgi:hypothetical protein
MVSIPPLRPDFFVREGSSILKIFYECFETSPDHILIPIR